MDKKEEEFFKRLLSAFKTEADEHLKVISSGLLDLEKTGVSEEKNQIVENIFRECHSLKGAARAVNMTGIESICSSLENIFSIWKKDKIIPSPELFDVLHSSVDTINNLLLSPENKKIKTSDIIRLIDSFGNKQSAATSTVRPAEKKCMTYEKKKEKSVPSEDNNQGLQDKIPHVSETETSSRITETPGVEKAKLSNTVKISTDILDSIFLQTEELLGAKQASIQRSSDLADISVKFEQWKKEWIKINRLVRAERRSFSTKNDQQKDPAKVLLNKVSDFFDWNFSHINLIDSKLKALKTQTRVDCRSIGTMIDNILDEMQHTVLLPFSSLLELFPKMVRDLSREQSKNVEFVVKGDQIEIDRRIISDMREPMIHLIRNCIDHGIEKPEDRIKNKKSVAGAVTIEISQLNNNQVEIIVSDDGCGIDSSKLKNAALKHKIIREERLDKLKENEILSLIFESGVSTSSFVTDISGRGLGLAIVREKVEELGGNVSVDSCPGSGTLFRLVLPITLARFRGIFIKTADQVFVVPSRDVERILRIKNDEIKTIENKKIVSVDGENLPLVYFNDVLEIKQKKTKTEKSDFIPALIIKNPGNRLVFCAEEIINEQEILAKTICRQLSRVKNIAGATALGSGQVVPILNTSDLLKSAMKVASVSIKSDYTEEEVETKKKSILVAEDSITSRMLLKNILESSGYNVETAVDGIDAFAKAKTEDFDIVVSDVDMPRMNGFGLTAKIREDKKLAELPVILVTALESSDDRERGIDAGADAYIIKSSFDQSNLLEVINRLI